MIQQVQNLFGSSPSSIPRQIVFQSNDPDISQMNVPQNSPPMRQNHQNLGSENSKRVRTAPSPIQIPPISPHSQTQVARPATQQMGSQIIDGRPSHSRSLSQPLFFSVDSLPPLCPSAFQHTTSGSMSVEAPNISRESSDGTGNAKMMLTPSSPVGGDNARHTNDPSRKMHRRSFSDIPFGFDNLIQPPSLPPPPVPARIHGGLERTLSGGESPGSDKPAQLVKNKPSWNVGRDGNLQERKGKKLEGDALDDFLSAYMDLDSIEIFNSHANANDENCCNENRDGMGSQAGYTKTIGCKGSDNEAESSLNKSDSGRWIPSSCNDGRMEGLKRSASGDVAPSTRHCRSVSVDSGFMGKLQFIDELPKLPPSPSTGMGQLSLRSNEDNRANGNSSNISLEFCNGEFKDDELKRIMANEKLAEIALIDPKRAKRILANRQSAARSKERRVRYIQDLEHKVQTLQAKTTSLSAHLTVLQRDCAALTSKNNELRCCLESMEKQAQLRDTLNITLKEEVRRLKIAVGEQTPDSMGFRQQEQPMYSQMFHQHQLQSQPVATQNQLQQSSPAPESQNSSTE